ncbi:4Fe-4S binding protein [bacterium]|nr:4Fe-4S binding protein [bacterium]
MKPDISTKYLGIELKSPIIVAPAGITETADRIALCAKYGAGAVVMKTMTDVELMRNSPTPRFRLLKKGKGLRNFVLYSYEQASLFNSDDYAAEIAKSRRETDIAIIASIACSTDESWQNTAKMMEDAGAHALEINLSCPHGPDMAVSMGIEKRMIDITELVTSAVNIPIVPKLPSQLTDPITVVKGIQKAGAKGVVIFNRLLGLDIDIEKQSPIMHGGFAGHGGYYSIHYPLRWIAELSPLLDIDISASGGVASGDDAVKYLLAGASTVQICTSVILNGYPVIEKINSQIIEYMEKHDLESISQFRGKVCNRILGLNDMDRRKSVRAEIDQEKCKSCGACFNACFYGAVTQDNGKYEVTSKCAGCGLCAEICDFDAISMLPLE